MTRSGVEMFVFGVLMGNLSRLLTVYQFQKGDKIRKGVMIIVIGLATDIGISNYYLIIKSEKEHFYLVYRILCTSFVFFSPCLII